MDVAKILDKATDEMTLRGSCTQHELSADGKVCLRGAIGVALGLERLLNKGGSYRFNFSLMDWHLTSRYVRTAIIELYPEQAKACYLTEGTIFTNIAHWNDLFGTHDSRIEVLRYGAKLAREESQ